MFECKSLTLIFGTVCLVCEFRIWELLQRCRLLCSTLVNLEAFLPNYANVSTTVGMMMLVHDYFFCFVVGEPQCYVYNPPPILVFR